MLNQLLADPTVTDILINGHKQVWVDKGDGLVKTNINFLSEEKLKSLAQQVALARGKRLDQSQPYVDAQLSKTIRFHSVLFPTANPGTLISLRIHRPQSYSLTELVLNSTIDSQTKEFLELMIKENKSFVICGGTGCGKTTLLNSLISTFDENQRILVIEDSNELNPNHPHVISLEARGANLEGAGAITMKELIKQALRMRADRLIIGEVRGAEVIDWLSALNTGHKGGAGTIHANSIFEVISRFESLGLMAGINIETVHSLLKNALDYVIHIDKDKNGKRKVIKIGKFNTTGDNQLIIEKVLI